MVWLLGRLVGQLVARWLRGRWMVSFGVLGGVVWVVVRLTLFSNLAVFVSVLECLIIAGVFFCGDWVGWLGCWLIWLVG